MREMSDKMYAFLLELADDFAHHPIGDRYHATRRLAADVLQEHMHITLVCPCCGHVGKPKPKDYAC